MDRFPPEKVRVVARRADDERRARRLAHAGLLAIATGALIATLASQPAHAAATCDPDGTRYRADNDMTRVPRDLAGLGAEPIETLMR